MQSLQDIRVIIAAGGSAGHINPGLAIADKIKDVFSESKILFIGTPEGMEARLVKQANYDFASVKMAGMQRDLSVNSLKRNIKAFYYYINANRHAKKIIKDFKPDIVIGTGGYVSLPIIQTAAKLGIKTANHESNSLPGIATKMLAKYVDKIFVAESDAIKHILHKEKCVVTGNPMRTNIPIEDRELARKRLGLPEGITILSVGGSNGSNIISEAVAALLGWENREGGINHIHSYGRNGKDVFSQYLEKYHVKPNKDRTIINEYIDNMYTCYCAADIVICRAGSMTQTELKAIGRASIQIPWPGAAENHQYFNAKSMEDRGAAILIEDKDLTPDRLINKIAALTKNTALLRKMEENAGNMSVLNSSDLILGEIMNLFK